MVRAGKGDVKRKAGIGKQGARAKECRWPLETRKDQETTSPPEPPEGM